MKIRINLNRQAAIDAMGEEWVLAIDALSSVKYKPVYKDAISKHDLWRIIEDNAYWVTYNETSKEKGMTLTGINQALNECPPVEPERPKGEWIFNPKDAIDSMFTKPKCSECGFESADGGNFCSNCGADMRGNDYQRHIEDLEYCMRYEPTYNPEDGSM